MAHHICSLRPQFNYVHDIPETQASWRNSLGGAVCEHRIDTYANKTLAKTEKTKVQYTACHVKTHTL